MLTSGQAWDVLRSHAPRDQWLTLQDVYALVSAYVELDEQDRAPIATNGKSARWQRTVRNALQTHKQSSELEWDRQTGFRLPT